MRGYFGVAMWHPRTEDNVGTLWRSAKTYGASFIATVGRRYQYQASDTCKTPLSVPLHHYRDLDDLIEHLPHSCPIVGVELDDRAAVLEDFQHPPRCLYLMGAEDHGLPDKILARCHHVVRIDTPAPWSLNVSVAGSMVLHSRHLQTSRRAVAA